MHPNLIEKLSPGVIAICFILFTSGCSTHLRIQKGFVPANTLRLAQVMVIAKRATILTEESKPTYEALIASGIQDSDINDGSVVVARIFCCGGLTENYSSEKTNSIAIFIPEPLKVSLGDIVEVRSGRSPEKGDAGLINTMTRVVQKYGENDDKCWWDPKDDRLWLRILYCDWMPREGWIKQGGIDPAWYKPAVSIPPNSIGP